MIGRSTTVDVYYLYLWILLSAREIIRKTFTLHTVKRREWVIHKWRYILQIVVNFIKVHEPNSDRLKSFEFYRFGCSTPIEEMFQK